MTLPVQIDKEACGDVGKNFYQKIDDHTFNPVKCWNRINQVKMLQDDTPLMEALTCTLTTLVPPIRT
jgi:hypothetical protein